MLRPSEIAPDSFRPLRRREYEHLVRLGVYEGERVELLYGSVITMSPHGPAHDESVNTLGEYLANALGARAKVRVQSAFAASDGSEPEPDLSVVPRASYREAHPTKAWLIVEVAESSLRKDRGTKARLYAESGVEEYWVVDLATETLVVHRQPATDGYRDIQRMGRGEKVKTLRFPDVEIAVDAVFE